MSITRLYNENELLLQIANGDELAFKQVYDLSRNRIYSIAHQITKSVSRSEDIVQDVFLKLWLNKERLAEVDNFDAYINTITRNILFTQYKRLSLEATYIQLLKIESEGQNLQALFPDPAIYAEVKRIYGAAISKLTPQQKRVYLMGKGEGMKYEEIAQLLNISKDTVREHMMAALQSVKDQMKRYSYEIAYIVLFTALVADK